MKIYLKKKDIRGEKNPNYRSHHISKEILYALFIQQELTYQECAQKLNVGYSTIWRNLKKYGIQKNQRKSRWRKARCLACNKEFYYYEANQKGLYCSHQCAGQHFQGEKNINWIGGPVRVYCAYCQKPKTIWKSQAQMYQMHFCNSKCMGKWASQNRMGEANSNWRGGKKGRPPYPFGWRGILREEIRD